MSRGLLSLTLPVVIGIGACGGGSIAGSSQPDERDGGISLAGVGGGSRGSGGTPGLGGSPVPAGNGGVAQAGGSAGRGGTGGIVAAGTGGMTAPPAPAPGCPAVPGTGPNATAPGALTAPNPTLRNLTLEWAIAGDSNNNGVATLRYRQMGGAWRQGMPLRRTPAGSNAGFSWANRHSGSIFDLEPDSSYEIEVALLDTDGGCETRTITARTRPIPSAMAGAPIKSVAPGTLAAVMAAAAPGDILSLEAGIYPGFQFNKDGDVGKPIVIRGANGAIVNGNIDLLNRKYIHLTGLTVNGRIRFNGGRGLAFIKNIVNTTSDGIITYQRAEDCYIADNVITGATKWEVAALGVNGANVGEGILVTGPGHVIEHNRVVGFRDNISTLEQGEAVDQWSIDIIENDIDTGADDGVEADFCFHNCRIMRNRLTNVFVGISAQPSLGGPTYLVRNVLYNVLLTPFKLLRGSVGDVIIHNTVVKNGDAIGISTSDPIGRAYFRNNLAIGGPGGTFGGWRTGDGSIISIEAAQASCDLDYDGFGSTNGMFSGRIGANRFANLAELKMKTTERHAVQVDLTTFAGTISFPAVPFPPLRVPDLRLRSGGSAVDVGTPIPNLNDGFAGGGPDLGAHELGAPSPTYGPR